MVMGEQTAAVADQVSVNQALAILTVAVVFLVAATALTATALTATALTVTKMDQVMI